MPRGPHDQEIDQGDSDEDHARKRLEEFLKLRNPNPLPPDPQEEDLLDPQDSNRNPPAKP